MAEKRLFTELKRLVQSPPLLTNSLIISLEPVDTEGSILNWKAVIAKPSVKENSYYYNGKWTLDITADSTYPLKPPTIRFNRKTPINHPNVNLTTGEICLDILKDDAWSPAWNLENLVGAILMLIDDPEPDSPLNVDLANLFRFDKQAFESMVQYTMWSNGTLYDGVSDPVGTKKNDAALKAKDDGCTCNLISADEEFFFANPSFRKGETPSSDSGVPLGYHTPATDEDELNKNFQSIHNAGKEVTRQLLEKAKEVESKQGDFGLLDAVKNQVSRNVAKQIEEICQSTANNKQGQYAR